MENVGGCCDWPETAATAAAQLRTTMNDRGIAGSMALRQQALTNYRFKGLIRFKGSSASAGKLVDDFPIEPDEPVNFALENTLLIAMRAEAFRAVFEIRGRADAVALHAL